MKILTHNFSPLVIERWINNSTALEIEGKGEEELNIENKNQLENNESEKKVYKFWK